MRGRLFGILLLLLPVSGWPANLQDAKEQLDAYQRNIHQNRRGLERVHQRLQVEKQEVAQKQRKEHSVLADIQRVDRRLEEAEDTYQDHQQNLDLVRAQIGRLQTQVRGTEQEMARLRAFLAERLRLIYQERQIGFWRLVATSQSWSQALSRLKFMHVVATQNAFVLAQLTDKNQQLLQQTRSVLVQEHKAEDLEQAARVSLQHIQSTRAERQQLLQQVQEERAAHERAVAELEEASTRLADLIGNLETRAKKLKRKILSTSTNVSQRRHALPWPTKGQVVARFGKTRHPRFNTFVYNKGIDIKGTIGQNVVSVCSGQVIFAEWFEGYGRLIILDHGQGFNSVYAHLQNILVNEGDSVAEGQRIGTLGDSGTWKGPSLYFEIRKRGEALDPMDWLE